MAAGDLLTLPWQAELNGLLMGPSTSYVLQVFNPWAAPIVRSGTQERPQGSTGSYSGHDDIGDRLVPVDIAIAADSFADTQVPERDLAAAWAPPTTGVVPLVWMNDVSVKYLLFGKPQMVDPSMMPNVSTPGRFLATDPRIYSATLLQPSTTLPTGSGGLVFSAVAPFVFGSSGSGGSLDATNSGTIETPYVVVFTGPLVAPSIEHIAQGKKLEFTGTLAAGETLVVDSQSKTVMLNGTASRYSWLTVGSQWFTLAPGANALRFAGASGAGTAQISYRSAWI